MAVLVVRERPAEAGANGSLSLRPNDVPIHAIDTSRVRRLAPPRLANNLFALPGSLSLSLSFQLPQ